MGCISCGRGFHSECYNDGCVNCHDYDSKIKSLTTSGHRGAPVKDPESVKDRHSTGRKRAAQLYPLIREDPCEWRGKKNVGGGVYPIIGCIDGFQQHRHHGPNKDTLENGPGNVHRICTKCHNRWHARNNDGYDKQEARQYPHSPEPAEELELLANESYWKMRK